MVLMDMLHYIWWNV